ncbi:MAG: hypothetical protein DRJ50_12240 [Actinobacteria bacterium]|nr:MAG: hypothetical protein DRJ50_12240 [Actinomycetota bacterium]
MPNCSRAKVSTTRWLLALHEPEAIPKPRARHIRTDTCGRRLAQNDGDRDSRSRSDIRGRILIVGIAAIRPNAPVINSIERTWARLILNVAGVRVEIHHAHRIGRDQAYIVIANHRSIFDIMCLFAVLPLPIRFFTKRELFSIPFFGTMLRSLGMVSIDRSAADHAKINAASAGALDCGSSLIVFAEGTRGSAAG